MKILLIYPPVLGEKGILFTLKYMPIGIAYIAAILRQENYDVEIYDAIAEDATLSDVEAIIRQKQPDIVGISVTTMVINSAFETAEIAKKINPGTQVIIGGFHATAVPEMTLAHPNVDFVVVGEGEMTILKLMRALEQGKELKQVQGIGFKQGGRIIITPRRELISDLDSLPFPAYDLLPIGKYSSLISTRTPYASFIRSRGCPFQCIFCGVQTMFGRKYRCQSPERTIREIDYLIKTFGIKEILFKDSEFVVDRCNAMRFCKLLIEKNYDLVWSCNARTDRVTIELLQKMRSAGCKSISYGVESGSQKMIDNLRKGSTIETNRKAIAMTKEVGIKCIANIIVGSPEETRETFDQTQVFIRETKPDFINVAMLTPFPGSELWGMALKNDWFITKNVDMNKIEYEKLVMNATQMSKKALYKARNKINMSFYFRPSFIAKRLLTLNPTEIRRNVSVAFALILQYIKRLREGLTSFKDESERTDGQ